MSNERLTYGSTKQILEINGYSAASVTGATGWRAADEPGAVTCVKAARSVVALVITTCDAKIKAAILEVFRTHGIGKGVIRVDSAGNEHHIIQCGSNPPFSMETVAAPGVESMVVLDSHSRENQMAPSKSSVIPLSGDWPRGSLLDTPRSKLPAFDNFSALFSDLNVALSKFAPTVETEKPMEGAIYPSAFVYRRPDQSPEQDREDLKRRFGTDGRAAGSDRSPQGAFNRGRRAG